MIRFVSHPPRASDEDGTALSLVSSLSDAKSLSDVHHSPGCAIGTPEKIYGRGEEYAMLRNSFDRVRRSPTASRKTTNSASCSEVVLVYGESGSGKTFIVESIRNYVTERGKAFFACGKFDQMRGNEPYSAIVEAFADVVDLILQEGTDTIHRMSASIREELEETEIKYLTALVSNLVFLDANFQSTSRSIQGNIGGAEGGISYNDAPVAVPPFSRLKILFQSFLRAVSTPQHPIVLFLDDLQWADSASVELINSLTMDPESRHVLIVAAYRENEMDNDYLAKFSATHKDSNNDSSSENKSAFHLPVTRLQVCPLKLNSVNALVSDCLGLDAPTTLPLSEVILQKTLGNPYHITQYLESLEASKMLKISSITGKWEWDMPTIQLETDVSDNVVKLLAEKVQRLKGAEQAVLKTAACFGHSFHLRVLELVIVEEMKVSSSLSLALAECLSEDQDNLPLSEATKEPDPEETTLRTRLTRVLDSVTKMGLLEKTNTATQLKFSHDRVQSYSYSLSSSEERLAMHTRIGKVVWDLAKGMPRKQAQALKFFAVDQLNRGSEGIEDEEERVELSRINFDIGKLAASKAAYESAAAYMRHGISQLKEETRWTRHYDFALDLLSTSAEAEFSSGNFAQCGARVDEVLKNARSLTDKLRVYTAYIESLVTQRRFREAIRIGLDVLRQLGKKFPSRPSKLNVIFKYMAVKRALRGVSDDDILNLPKMTDPRKMPMIRVLDGLAVHAYFDGDKIRFGLFSLEMILLSLRLGVSKYSPLAFASFAMFMQNFGEFNEAYRFAKISLRLLQRMRARCSISMTLAVLHHFVFHHKRPLIESIDAFQQSHTAGMACGDISAGLFGASGILTSSCGAGIRLPQVEKECKSHCAQMVQFNQEYALGFSRPCWQFVLNLMGKAEDPLKLTGDAHDEDAAMAEALRKKSVLSCRILCGFKIQLLYLFEGDNSLLAHTVDMCERHADKIHFNAIVSQFFIGLSSYRLAMTPSYKRRRKYRSLARRKTRQFQRWINAGNESGIPMHALLRAEEKVMEGSKRHINRGRIYDDAIAAVRAAGIVQYEALAHERAANVMLEDGLIEHGVAYLYQAIRLYREWGAAAKVSSLEQKYDHFLLSRRDIEMKVSERAMDIVEEGLFELESEETSWRNKS